MKYAVLSISGRQLKVSEGDVFKVNKTTELNPKVLLVSEGGFVEVGNPYVDSASVKLELIKDLKGNKITIRRFKAKSRYHKTRGFRPELTELKVVSIKGQPIQEVLPVSSKIAREDSSKAVKSKRVSKK